MPVQMVSRSAEERAIDEFLTSAHRQPSALVIEGEAGIGKSTLWWAGLDRARGKGFRVLAARAAEPETVHAFATIGDLLAEVESSHVTGIPELQQRAVDRVLMRAADEGPDTDQWVIAAAFTSVVEALAVTTPALISVDDVQWLDSSSRTVLAYAMRRVKSRIGILVTERVGREDAIATSWLELATAGEVRRERVSALSLGGLHTLIEERLGHSFPRPTMTRIAEVSGGNPLYALELAREMDADPNGGQQVFPRTLAGLVRLRIQRLDESALDALTAASCVPNPTVDLLASVTGKTAEQIIGLLEEPEIAGIVLVDGNRIGFTHPVLAHGVYSNAAPARRRHWHRAWSKVVREPESAARHLALAATTSDPDTLLALDAAAAAVRARGAPAAAAELLDLAIGLGGDTPLRRYAAAEHHLRSGDAARAQVVLKPAIAQMPPGPLRALTLFGYAVIIMHTEGYSQAAEVLSEAINDALGSPAVLVQVRMMLAFALINDGVYEPALHQAQQALDEAEDAAETVLISQALAVWGLVSFNCGLGYDEAVLRRALELEDHQGDTPIAFRATAIHALLMAWTGRLDQSAAALEAVGSELVQRGGEIEMLFVTSNSALVSVWRGRYEAAGRYAEDTMQRAEQIGGAAMRAVGHAVRGWVSVHAGRAQPARDDLTAAIDAAQRSGSSPWWFELAVMGLGRLEVSLGRHAAALDVLAPLLAVADRLPTTEISKAEYLPDVIEAMIVMSRLEEAKALIDRLDATGREFDRAWMLAAAGRCRGMWLASTGHVDAAVEVVQAAMVHHQRLPMPLEQARTQLVLGQLQRRRRQKQVAAQALNEALRIFEQLGNPLWVERAHAELVRTTMSGGRAVDLTETERRVADLAADGLSNRDVAASLYISAKTVEAHLSRIYRKLGIHSRAELGRRMDQMPLRAHEAED